MGKLVDAHELLIAPFGILDRNVELGHDLAYCGQRLLRAAHDEGIGALVDGDPRGNRFIDHVGDLSRSGVAQWDHRKGLLIVLRVDGGRGRQGDRGDESRDEIKSGSSGSNQGTVAYAVHVSLRWVDGVRICGRSRRGRTSRYKSTMLTSGLPVFTGTAKYGASGARVT